MNKLRLERYVGVYRLMESGAVPDFQRQRARLDWTVCRTINQQVDNPIRIAVGDVKLAYVAGISEEVVRQLKVRTRI